MKHAHVYLALLREAAGVKDRATPSVERKQISGGCLLYQFPRSTRLEVAKAAMHSASSRHAMKPQAKPLVKPSPKPSRSMVSTDDAGTTRVRDEYAQDMSAWD